MTNQTVAGLLNTQINKELYSGYLYLAFANYYTQNGLDGFANWYTIQAQEERDHAMLFIKYMHNNNLEVILEAIDKPEINFSNNLEPLKAGLEHEQYVTGLIHTIYNAAFEIKDFRTMQFLDWFVKEQGEEETNAESLISKMEIFGSDPKAFIC
jgi:ferritin